MGKKRVLGKNIILIKNEIFNFSSFFPKNDLLISLQLIGFKLIFLCYVIRFMVLR